MTLMDNKVCNKGQAVVKKAKKNQVKNELDRIKQAEKKRRRLEKALAASAAIRLELEKKKQKKKEEQQRLDEEGAAIAESVALHVLIGEDSDDVCGKKEGFNLCSPAGNQGFVMSPQKQIYPQQEGMQCFPNAYGSGYIPGGFDNSRLSFSSWPYRRNPYPSYFEEQGWGTTGFSAGLIAAQAVSSLQIAEDTHIDALVFDGILRG